MVHSIFITSLDVAALDSRQVENTPRLSLKCSSYSLQPSKGLDKPIHTKINNYNKWRTGKTAAMNCKKKYI